MKHSQRYFWMALILLGSLVISLPGQTQLDGAAKRRLVEQTAVVYPVLARSMALQGTVRLEVLVTPDGVVKTVDIKGGHPVLAQAAATTVKQWKWEKSSHESREPVELKFSRE